MVLRICRSRVDGLYFHVRYQPKGSALKKKAAAVIGKVVGAHLAVSRSERLKKMVCDTEADPAVIDKRVEIFKLEKDLGSTAQGNEPSGILTKKLWSRQPRNPAQWSSCVLKKSSPELRTQLSK